MKYFNNKAKLDLTIKGYDKVATEWSASRQNFWEELKFIKKYLPSQTSILDIGCGNGRFAKQILDEYTYTGVDPSVELINIAKKDLPDLSDKFSFYDGVHLPFTDKSFDNVVSFAVMHHLPPSMIVSWLKESKRVLKEDGVAIFSSWDLWNTHQKELRKYYLKNKFSKNFFNTYLGDIVLGFTSHKNTRYVHSYTEKEIRKYFALAGYNILEMSYRSRESGNRNILIIANLNNSK